MKVAKRICLRYKKSGYVIKRLFTGVITSSMECVISPAISMETHGRAIRQQCLKRIDTGWIYIVLDYGKIRPYSSVHHGLGLKILLGLCFSNLVFSRVPTVRCTNVLTC